MTNNTTLSQAVKTIHDVSPMMPIKDILEYLNINHSHLKDKAHYRAVYNTLKRVSKGSNKTRVVKAIKAGTSTGSIIFDLTQAPLETVSGKVFFKGQA